MNDGSDKPGHIGVPQSPSGEADGDGDPKTLVERIRELQEKVLSRPATGLKADKAFFDWLSGVED